MKFEASEREQMIGAYSQFRMSAARPWEIALARLFGEKSSFIAEETMVTSYHWRGKVYVTDIRDVKTGKRL